MNKKYIYILIAIVLIIILPLFIKDDPKTFTIDGVKYAVSVDGKQLDRFPNKGAYNVNIECLNANGTWNYYEWILEIYNITGNVSCDISFETKSKVTLADYIKNLLGTNAKVTSTKDPSNSDDSILQKITDNGEEDYRYRGTNPNNYIKFNNEIWRIIGVFDDNTHGIDNTHLVKIIRNDHLIRAGWDFVNYESGSNYFPSSDISKILTAYYNHINVTNESYCYQAEAEQNEVNCDFTNIGIQPTYQNMVEENVNWFFGGAYEYIESAKNMYYNEKNKNYEKGAGRQYISTKEANIKLPVGIMYSSDFLYAKPDNCSGVCLDSFWLNSNLEEWTMTIDTSSPTMVFALRDWPSGVVLRSVNSYDKAFLVRPTLYLKFNVYYISGTGTQADPYIIGI